MPVPEPNDEIGGRNTRAAGLFWSAALLLAGQKTFSRSFAVVAEGFVLRSDLCTRDQRSSCCHGLVVSLFFLGALFCFIVLGWAFYRCSLEDVRPLLLFFSRASAVLQACRWWFNAFLVFAMHTSSGYTSIKLDHIDLLDIANLLSKYILHSVGYQYLSDHTCTLLLETTTYCNNTNKNHLKLTRV